MKAVIKGNWNAEYLHEKQQAQKWEIPTDNLSMHLNSLEKQEQNKLKSDRQGKIHKIKAEFNETTIRAKIYRINENEELALWKDK